MLGIYRFKKHVLKGFLLVGASFLVFPHIPALATADGDSSSQEIKTQADTENELISETMASFRFLSQ